MCVVVKHLVINLSAISGISDTSQLWVNDVENISPTFSDISDTCDLRRNYIISIITQRTNNRSVAIGKRQWLSIQNVSYDHFVRASGDIQAYQESHNYSIDKNGALHTPNDTFSVSSIADVKAVLP